MAGTRTLAISYGTFDSNDTGSYLTGVHTIDLDERTFKCEYTVVLQHESSETTLNGYQTAMEDQLNQRHQDFKIVNNGVTVFHFVDGTGTMLGGEEGAEFIMASVEQIPLGRTGLSRAFKIVVTVTRSAKQTGKLGVYDQSIGVQTLPSGQRRMSFRAQFTPGYNIGNTGTAEDRYGDATYGFSALVTAIQGVLGGTWERTGSINQSYDEDKRTLTASSTYLELLFDQSKEGRNDPDLIGVKYDIQVDRPSGYTIPGGPRVVPLTACTVSFSATVDVALGADLKAIIEDTIIPYVTDTVSKKLLIQADPKLLKHSLRADYVTNRVAGNLFYLVEEANVLEFSKRVATTYRRGVSLIPVLDGKEFTRDMHTGPGRQFLRVILGARVIGRSAAQVMKSVEEDETRRASKSGYVFTGYGVTFSPSTEYFDWAGKEIETTVQTSVLEFEKANIRAAQNLAGPGVTQTRRAPVDVGGSLAGGARGRDTLALKIARKLIEGNF